MRRRAARVVAARDGLVLARPLLARDVDLLLDVDYVVDHDAHLNEQPHGLVLEALLLGGLLRLASRVWKDGGLSQCRFACLQDTYLSTHTKRARPLTS